MIHVKIVTPEGRSAEMDMDRITLPSVDGERTILPNHMEIVVPLGIGALKVINPKEDHPLDKEGKNEVAIADGIFHFKDNLAHVFVRSFEFPDEIDLERAERAQKRAEDKLAQEKISRIEFMEAELALKRALNRLATGK